jgi:hypothetical protein
VLCRLEFVPSAQAVVPAPKWMATLIVLSADKMRD